MDAAFINGDVWQRVPYNLNISFAYVEGGIDDHGAQRSGGFLGSACTSASLEPSYVLRALGREDELAIRRSALPSGRFTTEEEIDYAAKLLYQKNRQSCAKCLRSGRWCRKALI